MDSKVNSALAPLLLVLVSASKITTNLTTGSSSQSSSSEPSSLTSSSSSPIPSSSSPTSSSSSFSSSLSPLCPCASAPPVPTQCPTCPTLPTTNTPRSHTPSSQAPPTLACHSGADALSRELAAYKVVTGLLSVTVLLIVLVRFGPPIYTTACRRLFGRRKREWIGPTESVSFRAQNTLYPKSNADKRQSFPGLERLTVSDSREPSSNRNSDYDSYN